MEDQTHPQLSKYLRTWLVVGAQDHARNAGLGVQVQIGFSRRKQRARAYFRQPSLGQTIRSKTGRVAINAHRCWAKICSCIRTNNYKFSSLAVISDATTLICGLRIRSNTRLVPRTTLASQCMISGLSISTPPGQAAYANSVPNMVAEPRRPYTVWHRECDFYQRPILFKEPCLALLGQTDISQYYELI
jgi:hypothetical protein